MYSFLVDNSKNAKRINKKAVGKIALSKYKDVFPNKKMLEALDE